MLPPEYDTSTLHVTFGLLFAIWGGDNRKILPNWRSQVFIRGSHDERERKKEVTNEYFIDDVITDHLSIMCFV